MVYMLGNTYCRLCQTNDEQLKRALVLSVRTMYWRGMVSNAGGNQSARLPGSDKIWITPSGYPRSELEPEDLVQIDLDGNVIKGDLRPSIEVNMHLQVYKNRPDVNAVIHAHPPYTMGAALSGYLEITHGEAAAILGDIKIIPYSHPGTVELARNVGEAVRGEGAKVPRIVILMNHGIISVGACVHEARAFAEIMEEWSRFNVASLALGGIKYKLSQTDLRKPGARYIRAVKFGGRPGSH
ncbi:MULTISPECIES: class II aldolase/adducin family protein [Metallosphaera]|uniref:Class II aldolase/adducin family protein n=3 Tax=Metallosphaera TaxID=41980 RepID=A4YF99_METS5|nr:MULTISPECIES: class II aldolase/adducin family protein [Metallosphaera]ABP95101.1 class II aldolase/adducin family protein [Metallosphaera sedula DSM 5348]AIM27087.1 class II aldolase/adducin family protein [Metallosphaera sedula]AKV74000.1 aldolase [Metallosphaera sedula]AKV76239.1 aldolase [Metallosphaera sedula]AKV78492.1 aldolase [Metallosphaera sedula]